MTNARLEELRTKFQENPRRYFAPFANELRKAGDTAQAISVCRAHLSGQPGHVSGHIVLGQALYEAGESSEARDIFTASLELDPENLIALRTLGEIAQIDGEFDAARQWYERLLDADPRNSEVSQLLKDLPQAASAPGAMSAAVDTRAGDTAEPLPFNATEKHEPPPNFHTSFTGSQKAYQPEAEEQKRPEPQAAKHEPEPIEALQESESETAATAPELATASHDQKTDELHDLPPTANFDFSEPEPEPVQPVSAASHNERDESIDMVDLDDFPSATASSEAPPAHVPDLSTHAEDESFEFEPASEAAPEPVAGASEFDMEEESQVDPTPPAAEAPRARFAEFGFEGPADDQIGWMTTPSASLSEPEAAPDDWFDEETAPPEPAATEAHAEEPAAAEMSAQNPTVDSWFDEVEGAAVIEATQVTSEEFWLPPDLHNVSSPAAEQAAEPPASEDVEEQAPHHEPAIEPDVPAYAAQEPQIERDEPEHFSVEVAAEAEPDAVVVERPAEFETISYWSRPESAAPQAHEDAPVAEERDEPETLEPALDYVEYFAAAPVAESEPAPIAEAEATPMAEAMPAPVAESPAPPAMMGLTPGYDSSSSAPPVQPQTPFVTETLAELYLQQGFRDEALAIYRQLAERNPGDEVLRQRIESMEQSLSQPVAQSSEAPAENRAASQSVRTFFSRLARRNAVTPSAPAAATRTTPDVPFAAAASALANLFAASKPPASDEGAASTLAGAFTDPAGRPSRAADRELSLDHLFRDVPPGGQASGGVSLDEFYATPNAQPSSPTEPGEAGESPESGGTDIRQFTAWLEGLRKK